MPYESSSSDCSTDSDGQPRPRRRPKQKKPMRAVTAEEKVNEELTEAAARNDKVAVERLLGSNLVKDINWRRPGDGNSALHLAAAEGYLEVVQCLLDARADPELHNDFGLKPVSLAEAGTKVFELLDGLTERPMVRRLAGCT
mmetsp:Transcript_71011/g.148537  ORF Transcript_71011/g.148537 Transcript_71011/m.148537 type:complete len:142 (+) Transcript_71011:140-565(+)